MNDKNDGVEVMGEEENIGELSNKSTIWIFVLFFTSLRIVLCYSVSMFEKAAQLHMVCCLGVLDEWLYIIYGPLGKIQALR